MNTKCKACLHCLSSVARATTILTFGSMPYDRGSPKCAVWPRRDRTARGGGNKRRQENRAGWMEVLIRPTSRDIWLGQQKNRSQKQIIFPSDFPLEPVQTNHTDLRASVLNELWGFSCSVAHSSLPVFIYPLLTLGVQTHVGVITSVLIPQIITFTPSEI